MEQPVQGYVDVASWPIERKVYASLWETVPLLAPTAGAQLRAMLLSPGFYASLGVFAAVLGAGHFFGYTWIAYAILAVAGWATMGMVAWRGVGELWAGGRTASSATSEKEILQAAQHFATGIDLLGITLILAFFTRTATHKGKPPSQPAAGGATHVAAGQRLPAAQQQVPPPPPSAAASAEVHAAIASDFRVSPDRVAQGVGSPPPGLPNARAAAKPVRPWRADVTPTAVVAGGGPAGTMSALGIAQASKQAGLSRSTTLLIEARGPARTRDRPIRMHPQAIANMESLGIKLVEAESPGLVALQPVSKRLSPTPEYNRPKWDQSVKQMQDVKPKGEPLPEYVDTNIYQVEQAAYQAITNWNRLNPNHQIKIEYNTSFKDIHISELTPHYITTSTGRRVETKHLLVADGGRDVTKELVAQNRVSLIDRNVSTHNKKLGAEIRLQYVNEPVLQLGGSTVAFVGDAVATVHFYTSGGVVRATTDGIAARTMYSKLLRPQTSPVEFRAAVREYRQGRTDSIKHTHQLSGEWFKGQQLSPSVAETLTRAAKDKRELAKLRKQSESGS